jgi:hypothetical protein
LKKIVEILNEPYHFLIVVDDFFIFLRLQISNLLSIGVFNNPLSQFIFSIIEVIFRYPIIYVSSTDWSWIFTDNFIFIWIVGIFIFAIFPKLDLIVIGLLIEIVLGKPNGFTNHYIVLSLYVCNSFSLLLNLIAEIRIILCGYLQFKYYLPYFLLILFNIHHTFIVLSTPALHHRKIEISLAYIFLSSCYINC